MTTKAKSTRKRFSVALAHRIAAADAELADGAGAAALAYRLRFAELVEDDPDAALAEYEGWKRHQVDVTGMSGRHAVRNACIATALELLLEAWRKPTDEGRKHLHEIADYLLCAAAGPMPATGEPTKRACEAMGERLRRAGAAPIAHAAYEGKLDFANGGVQAAHIVMVARALGIGEITVKRALEEKRRAIQPRDHASPPH